ncbi:MAG: WGR domain-containing protein [Desulfobulbaceae bacterium]|nr:WGR domain-containing protein [Desulfobulbaceae bacterium]
MANKIKSRKVHSYVPENFTETLEFQVLACGNVENNNNKFYCIEIQKDSTNGLYRLFTHYGRIGMTNVYEVRDNIEGVPVSDAGFAMLEKEYHAIIKKKKKYKPVDTQEPTVGSENIRGKSMVKSTAGSKGDLKILDMFDDRLVKVFIEKVWQENIHNITNMTTMSVTSSGISSPLGALTLSHIQEAMGVLEDIQACYKGDQEWLQEGCSAYYSMIPHSFGHIVPQSAIIDDDKKFMVEYDLLKQMESVLQVTDDTDDEEDLPELGMDIALLPRENPLWDDLDQQYTSSRANCHSHLKGWKIQNIFEVDHRASRKMYDDGPERYKVETMRLFHGSRACNILSIMMNGLIVPPSTAGHVTGRMFGDGIYAASASTKALNYATGWWSGDRNKHPEAYMFVVEFAMGEIEYPTRPKYNGASQGFDSIWAKKEKTNLANDEFIVYNTCQAKITHLLQLKER